MDTRIDYIFNEEMRGDTSFTEKPTALSLIFGTNKYSQLETRETWHRGIKHGIEIGLRRGSLEGQKIELHSNTSNNKHKEFLQKFYALADEYKCGIQYHPCIGLIIVDRENNTRL